MIQKIRYYLLVICAAILGNSIQALETGIASLQGKRSSQEDRAFVQKIDSHTTLIGLFDGHGGSECVDYIENTLSRIITSKLNNPTEKSDLLHTEKILALLCESFRKANDDFYNRVMSNRYKGFESGTTASIALVRNSTLYIAYIGDSRIVRSNGKALTEDHTLNNEKEKERIVHFNKGKDTLISIMKRTKRLTADQSIAVPSLAITRAFGDFRFTPVGLISEPQVCYTPLRSDDFIIVASDGIWDVISNQEAVSFVYERLKHHISLPRIAHELCLYAASHQLDVDYTQTEKDTVKKTLIECDDATLKSKAAHSKTGHDNQTVVIVRF